MSADRDNGATFYSIALAQARALPTEELRRHARVAELEGYPHCNQCFCCACFEILVERDNAATAEWNRRRVEATKAQYVKRQAEKEADRKRWGME